MGSFIELFKKRLSQDFSNMLDFGIVHYWDALFIWGVGVSKRDGRRSFLGSHISNGNIGSKMVIKTHHDININNHNCFDCYRHHLNITIMNNHGMYLCSTALDSLCCWQMVEMFGDCTPISCLKTIALDDHRSPKTFFYLII